MTKELHQLTAKIVSAYVGNNAIPADQVGDIISGVYSALHGLTQPVLVPEAISPAVPIKRSVKPDEIICLECGRGMKMLKRHLRSDHGMTVEDYRAKWGLPPDYPVVAPTYANQRSDMAKQIGLGTNRAKPSTHEDRVPPRALDLTD